MGPAGFQLNTQVYWCNYSPKQTIEQELTINTTIGLTSKQSQQDQHHNQVKHSNGKENTIISKTFQKVFVGSEFWVW